MGGPRARRLGMGKVQPAYALGTALVLLATLCAPTAALAAEDTLDQDQQQELQDLRERVEWLEADQQWTEQRVNQAIQSSSKLSGYVDFGFFRVTGDGRGIRSDLGYRVLPEYEGVVADSWVFLGDPLSTAINSRGDPADVAESRAVTFDAVGNRGKPSFILNAVNVQYFTGVGDDLTVNAMVDLLARGRNVSDPDGVAYGDVVDVKLGYIEYRLPTPGLELSLFAGKFDSVLGVEYRTQEAPSRLSVTPSLICRYTCGRPLGVKARAQLLDRQLTLNLAATNGSHSIEGFPIYNEVDLNSGKTIAGRLSYDFALGAKFELGASGSYGAQDLQPQDDVIHWHYGVDLSLDVANVLLDAEFVQGNLQGLGEPGEAPCNLAPCLDYRGAYGLLGYRATNWLTPYARLDWRDALHQNGASFVYVSQLARSTLGLRSELGTHIVVKGEYTFNRELGVLPQIPNNILATSLVGRF